MMALDVTGQRFGRLVAISFSHSASKKRYWNFQCDCGESAVLRIGDVKSGRTKSCGCLNRDPERKYKHGHATPISPTYHSWASMIQRCTNENREKYPSYGGRGISVCDRWKVFENFLEDMGERPDNTSIDRIDVNENYEPKNCRWATAIEQANNKRPRKRRVAK